MLNGLELGIELESTAEFSIFNATGTGFLASVVAGVWDWPRVAAAVAAAIWQFGSGLGCYSR
jgi:hypothetical protein